MAISHICDECGNELDDEEIEFADIDGDSCLCGWCNSVEGDVDPADFDGRFED